MITKIFEDCLCCSLAYDLACESVAASCFSQTLGMQPCTSSMDLCFTMTGCIPIEGSRPAHSAASSTILECFGTLSFLESLLIFGCRIGPIGRTYWELSLHKDTVSRACILKPCHSTPNTYLSTCGFNC